MTIIATSRGTPSATAKNATACPGSAACSDLPSRYAATKPSNPAINARSVPTCNPSSYRDAHARAATSTVLVASTATTNTNPLTGDDGAASIAPSPGQSHHIAAHTLPGPDRRLLCPRRGSAPARTSVAAL